MNALHSLSHEPQKTIAKKGNHSLRKVQSFVLNAISALCVVSCTSEDSQSNNPKRDALENYSKQAPSMSTFNENFQHDKMEISTYHTKSAKKGFSKEEISAVLRTLKNKLGDPLLTAPTLNIITYDIQDTPSPIHPVLEGIAGTAINQSNDKNKGCILLEQNSPIKILTHELIHFLYQERDYQSTSPDFLVEGPTYMQTDPKESFENIRNPSKTVFDAFEGLFAQSLSFRHGEGYLLKKDVAARFFYEVNAIDPSCISTLVGQVITEDITPENLKFIILIYTAKEKQAAMQKFLDTIHLFDPSKRSLYCIPTLTNSHLQIRCATTEEIPKQHSFTYSYQIQGVKNSMAKKITAHINGTMDITTTIPAASVQKACVEENTLPTHCFTFETSPTTAHD